MKKIALIVAFLVSWKVTVQVPCPPKPLPPPDPYTGEPVLGVYSTTLEMRYCYDTKSMERRFLTREEADRFIAEAPPRFKPEYFTVTEVE